MSVNGNQTVSDEMLMALADGELNERDAEILNERIAGDADLQARYAMFIETAEAMRTALAQGPVPRHLIEAVQPAPASGGNIHIFPGRALAWPMSIAAALVLGIGLGWGLKATGPGGPSTPDLPGIAQALAGLQTGQSKTLPNAGEARVIGTFDTAQGLCRLQSLTPASGSEIRFVACLDDGPWQVSLSIAQAPGDAFAPASADATEMIDLFLDSIEAGPALSPEEERAALNGAQPD